MYMYDSGQKFAAWLIYIYIYISATRCKCKYKSAYQALKRLLNAQLTQRLPCKMTQGLL